MHIVPFFQILISLYWFNLIIWQWWIQLLVRKLLYSVHGRKWLPSHGTEHFSLLLIFWANFDYCKSTFIIVPSTHKLILNHVYFDEYGLQNITNGHEIVHSNSPSAFSEMLNFDHDKIITLVCFIVPCIYSFIRTRVTLGMAYRLDTFAQFRKWMEVVLRQRTKHRNWNFFCAPDIKYI